MTDSASAVEGCDSQVLGDPEQLLSFFPEPDNGKQKCVFVFGTAFTSFGD